MPHRKQQEIAHLDAGFNDKIDELMTFIRDVEARIYESLNISSEFMKTDSGSTSRSHASLSKN